MAAEDVFDKDLTEDLKDPDFLSGYATQMAAMGRTVLTPENMAEVREGLIEQGRASYPAFDGSGLVLPHEDYRVVEWGREIDA